MKIIVAILAVSIVHVLQAQSPGDCRSRQTGAWSAATSWQTFDGTSWINAVAAPSSASGVITILSTHVITSATAITADQVVVNSGGTLNITGGTFTLNDTSGTDLDCSGTLALSNATLTGAGTITFNTGSTFNWTSGYNAGSGIMNINAGAVFNMSGGNLYFADTKTINNYGTWNWTSGSFLYFNAAPIANNYGTFNISTDADAAQYNATTGSFNNKSTGIINKIGSPDDETYFNNISSFSNAGTINVNASRLRLNVNSVNTGTINIAFGANMAFSTGATVFNAGTVIAGDGSLNFESGADTINAASINVKTINITNGTVNVSTALTMGSGSMMNLSNGTLTGAGTITFNTGSTFNWTSGYNAGSGIMNINAGAVFNMSGGNLYFADTKTINNYGTWNWTSGSFLYFNAAPIANNYGTFNISTDADAAQYNATTGSFNNKSTGIINKIGSPDDETYFNNISSFSNAGTINVNASRLRLNVNSVNTGTINIAFGANMAFSTGATVFNAGTVIAGDGSLNFESGADTINAASINVKTINITNGTVNVSTALTMGSGSMMNLSNGTLTGAGTITFNTGSTFNWTSGYNAGSGIMNINAGAVFNMSGGNLYFADTKTINNYGTWNWTSGSFLYFNAAPMANNYGTFNISTDADAAQYNASTGSFNNKSTGIINKIGSPDDETHFNNISAFNNAGAININSGNLALNVPGTHTGTYKIAYGAQLRGSLSMSFTGNLLTNNGDITLAGLTFNGAAAQSVYGSGSINTLILNNANGLTLGGTQTINTALTLASGKITLGDNSLILGPSATLTGGNSTNYVVMGGLGSLQRRVPNNNTSVLFPVGFAASYLPVGIQLPPTSTADNFSVRLVPNIYGGYDTTNGNTVGKPIAANTVNASWFISESTPGGASATITFQWNDVNEAAGFSRAASRFGQYKSGAWSMDPATVAASGTNPYTITRAGLTSFSVFGITNQFVTSMNNFVAFCTGGAVAIPYSAVGSFNAGNVFTAQLSDSTGSYAAPVTIGSVVATASGSINATVPASTLTGTGYKIRVVSSSPALVGPDNPSIIPIRTCSATPPILAKAVPPKINVSEISLTGALVSWEKVPSATGYEVGFRPAAGTGWTLVRVAAEKLLMGVLQPGTPYNVKVRTEAASGFSEFSDEHQFTTLQADDRANLTNLPEGKLLIYPNPSHGQFVLLLGVKDVETGNAIVQIVNAAGQLVHKESIPFSAYAVNKTISFNPQNSSSGIYFITVTAGGKLYHGNIHYLR